MQNATFVARECARQCSSLAQQSPAAAASRRCPWCGTNQDAMFLLAALQVLCAVLFLLHVLFLVASTKILASLHIAAAAADNEVDDGDGSDGDRDDHCSVEDSAFKDDDCMAFWFGESRMGCSVLVGEARELLEAPCLAVKAASFDQKEEVLPRDQLPVTPPDVVSVEEDGEEQLDADGSCVTDSLPVDAGREDGEKCGGLLAAAGESTSKSSVEWRSSTITKDSENDLLFSSSSRRSSSNWESYTIFRKYDEDMLHFHRIGSEKLTEAESYRSIHHKPRSMSERVTHRFTAKPPKTIPAGLVDPRRELEAAYVAQVCLTWEALSWNYGQFQKKRDAAGQCGCPARVAQEFQEFQVLLQRFIETEPFERGRRPEVYARIKNSSPRLLVVPEFRESSEDEEEDDDLISSSQFLSILQEAIKTFRGFLKADKPSKCERLKSMVIKRRSSMIAFLKNTNKKKKARLKELTTRRRCGLKRKAAMAKEQEEEEAFGVLVALVDLKVVARVLRMATLTAAQLHWCEEKMTKVRISGGKMIRDPSPLFFPAD